jgi:excisionase family DNA binding protein
MIRELLREELACALPLRREAKTVEPLLVDVETAGVLLGVSARTIERMVADGELTPLKIGSRTLIARRDLERLIEERKRQPAKVG